MKEYLGDESILLRINELENGFIQFTDTTNAYRMLVEHGKDIRYNSLWKKWLVWNGKQWEMDEGYLIHDKGLQIIRGIYREILKTADYRERIDIEKHAMQSESARRRKALIEVASWIPELNVKTDDLDKDPWLFNVRNGTVDLRTGEFREHSQNDLITRIANVILTLRLHAPHGKNLLWRL